MAPIRRHKTALSRPLVRRKNKNTAPSETSSAIEEFDQPTADALVQHYRSNRAPLRWMAIPENQDIVVAYVQRRGAIVGCGPANGITDRTIYRYCLENPEFQKRLDEAKRHRLIGAFTDDFQASWNRNKGELNGLAFDRFVQYLLEGEVEVHTKTTYVPVRNTQGDIVLDEDEEPTKELEREHIDRIERRPPRWVIEMAIQLMRGDHEQPLMFKWLPSMLVQFIQYLRQHTEIDGATQKMLVTAVESFENEMRSKVIALTGKLPRN